MAFDGRKNLAIVGRFGSGKSSTGNSILGRNDFEYADTPESVTPEVGVAREIIDGHVVTVVDTPGLGDADLTKEEEIKKAIESMKTAFQKCPEGFDAILYVVGFGVRITKDYLQDLHVLKCVLGVGVLEAFGVLVITFGDKFLSKNHGETFIEWLKRNANGNFNEMLASCGGRIILFNNKTMDENEKRTQVRDLFALIPDHRSRAHRYCTSHFQLAEKSRVEILVQAYRPVVQQKVETELEELKRDFMLVQRLNPIVQLDALGLNPIVQLDELDYIDRLADSLITFISDYDKGTGLLCNLNAPVEHLKTLISQKKTDVCFQIEKKRKEEEIERELRQRHEQQKRKEQQIKESIKKQQQEARRRMQQQEMRRRQIEEQRLLFEQQKRDEKEELIGNVVGGGVDIILNVFMMVLAFI